MFRIDQMDSAVVARARAAVVRPCSPRDFRAAQAVLLRAVLGASVAETAAVLGVGRATVARLQVRFLEQGRAKAKPSRRNWGGRRCALLSLEEEREFLLPWLAAARTQSVPIMTPLREALSERLGRSVSPSVVYRLLERHNWRKVLVPDAPQGVNGRGSNGSGRKAWRPPST